MYRTLIDLAPEFYWTYPMLARVRVAQGDPEAALAELQKDPAEETRLLILPTVLEAMGRSDEADSALKAQIATWSNKHPWNVATTYGYRGDKDATLHWLDRAYDLHDPSLLEIVGEHLFKSIADDPHFKAFLRKMNLPEAAYR